MKQKCLFGTFLTFLEIKTLKLLKMSCTTLHPPKTLDNAPHITTQHKNIILILFPLPLFLLPINYCNEGL